MAEIIDITKDMTLGEIRSRNVDNFHLLSKTLRTIRFNTEKAATIVAGIYVYRALAKLGVDQKAIMAKYEKMGKHRIIREVDKALERNNVKAETMGSGYEDRSGWYLYHHNEMAYFISNPIRVDRNKSRSGLIYIKPSLGSQVEWQVKTNVPEPKKGE